MLPVYAPYLLLQFLVSCPSFSPSPLPPPTPPPHHPALITPAWLSFHSTILDKRIDFTVEHPYYIKGFFSEKSTNTIEGPSACILEAFGCVYFHFNRLGQNAFH